MKNHLKFISGLLMALLVGVMLSAFTGADPVYTIMGSFAAGAAAKIPSGAFGGTLLTEIFATDIQNNLFPDNSFYKRSSDDSAWIENNKINLPQAGAKPTVAVDRTSLPATVAKRTDTAEDYTLQEFTTDPILIQDTEALIVSYDKRSSILADHNLQLNTTIADNFAIVWSPAQAANIVRTTGTTRASSAPGSSGTRKGLSKADFIEAARLLDRMNCPSEGRICVIPADMLADIRSIDEFTHAEKFGTPGLPSGVITRIMGFDIFVRSKVSVYNNAGTPVKKALGAATAATDNSAGLFYHPSFVRRAEGSVKVFEKVDDPTFYGSIFSALVRAGGRIKRTDEAGVVAMVETLVS